MAKLPPEALAAYVLSTPTFVQRYLSDLYFTEPFTDQQLECFDIMDARNSKGNPAYNKILIMEPRGCGKTTTVQGYATKSICTRAFPFVTYYSVNQKLAILQTECIKKMLKDSEGIRDDFGRVGMSTYEDNGVKSRAEFSKESYVARFPDASPGYMGSFILPRGAGQGTSGWKFGPHRPSLLIFDDLEDRETMNNEEITKALYTWLISTALQTVEQREMDPSDRNWQAIYIDTLKGQNSAMMRLIDDPSWKVLDFPLCDADYKTKMPTFKSQIVVDTMVKEHRANGTLDVFYREFMNQPMAAEGAPFEESSFKDIPKDITYQTEGVETVILCDLAKSTNPKSDWSAHVAVGVSMQRNAIYVWDVVAGHFHPDENYQIALDLAIKYGTHVIGREVTGLNEFVTYPMDTFIKSKGIFMEMIDLKARGRKKEDRIKSLIPMYRQGWVYHNREKCTHLEAQLMTFPKSRRDDIMDALAYIVEMLDVGGRFFSCMRSDTHGQVGDGSPEITLLDEYGNVINMDYEDRMLKQLEDEEESDMYEYSEI